MPDEEVTGVVDEQSLVHVHPGEVIKERLRPRGPAVGENAGLIEDALHSGNVLPPLTLGQCPPISSQP